MVSGKKAKKIQNLNLRQNKYPKLFYTILGARLARLQAMLAHVGSAWSLLGAMLARLRAMLAHFGACFAAYVGPCWPILIHKREPQSIVNCGTSDGSAGGRHPVAGNNWYNEWFGAFSSECRTAVPGPGGFGFKGLRLTAGRWPSTMLALCWAYVGLRWAYVGPCWAILGALLGPCLGHLCWNNLKMPIFPPRAPSWRPKPRKNPGLVTSPRWNPLPPKGPKHRKKQCFCSVWSEEWCKM